MFDVVVHLIKQGEAAFTGHVVTATFKTSIPAPGSDGDGDGKQIIVADKISAPVQAEDRAHLSFPNKTTLQGDILFEVVAPDGAILASLLSAAADLESEVRIPAEAKQFGKTQPSDDPGYGTPTQVRGRVIDRAGKRQIAGVQVVLFARPADGGNGDARPLLVTETDDKGYFFGPYPVGTFASAHGAVGVAGTPEVPIHLNADGGFPRRVILVLDLPEDSDVGADAGDGAIPRQPETEDLVSSSETFKQDLAGGKCIEFHKPNRTIESFDFFSVVRTTEPAIKGLTLTEPPKIDVGSLVELISTKTAQVLARTDSASAPSGGGAGFGRRLPGASFAPGPDAVAAPAPARGRPATAGLASVDDLLEVDALAESLSAAAADTGSGEAAPATARFKELADVEIEADIAAALAEDPDGFSLTRLASAELATNARRLTHVLNVMRAGAPGRGELDRDVAVDWDLTPTIYQTCEVAHGHVLQFKQEWIADGYSLGDLVYSLPLAPCQKKNIAVVDWERRETATRVESLEEREELTAFLSRDRDISEIATASLSEEIEGGSSASTEAFGGGLAGGVLVPPVGALLGIGGGFSDANSSAWQTASRSTAATNLQKLRDRTRQAASAVRSQRATVVQTVRQGETVRAETEVVANHNHCHAITMQYFEVLRHFLVRTNLADVRECLFVPLLMSRFDSAKALRWREPLRRFLRERSLRPGFEALERIKNDYAGSNLPEGAYAEENLEAVDGFLRITFRFARPRDGEDGEFVPAAWEPLERLLGFDAREFFENFLAGQARRDRIFAEELGERLAAAVVDALRVSFEDAFNNQISIPVDATLVSNFRNASSHYVSIRLADALPSVRRSDIRFVRVSAATFAQSGQALDDVLPAGSRIVVDGGQMRYRTQHIGHDLFNRGRIRNDLGGRDEVLVFTPLSQRELEDPREKDRERARRLLKHLNEHLEFYHRIIWTRMDPQRRYLLLDGFIAPNSEQRSIASVVENRLIGIAGNCLVMPVAPGFHLDPTFGQDVEEPVDLLEHYAPTSAEPPLSVAVPTKGVFGEAVMGACNSCEEIDESRFWRWEESPCPDDPAPIQPPSTASRRGEPPDLTAKDFPSPIISQQNAPAAPDPTGLSAALSLLGKPDAFRDVTGLSQTQKNALAALQGALGTAEFFGGKVADLLLQGRMSRDVDKAVRKIQQAEKDGLLTKDQAQSLTEKAFQGMIGDGAGAKAEPASPGDVEDIADTAGRNRANISVDRPSGERIDVDARPPAEEPPRRELKRLERGPQPDLSMFEDTGLVPGPSGSTLFAAAPDAQTLDRFGLDKTAEGTFPLAGLYGFMLWLTDPQGGRSRKEIAQQFETALDAPYGRAPRFDPADVAELLRQMAAAADNAPGTHMSIAVNILFDGVGALLEYDPKRGFPDFKRELLRDIARMPAGTFGTARVKSEVAAFLPATITAARKDFDVTANDITVLLEKVLLSDPGGVMLRLLDTHNHGIGLISDIFEPMLVGLDGRSVGRVLGGLALRTAKDANAVIDRESRFEDIAYELGIVVGEAQAALESVGQDEAEAIAFGAAILDGSLKALSNLGAGAVAAPLTGLVSTLESHEADDLEDALKQIENAYGKLVEGIVNAEIPETFEDRNPRNDFMAHRLRGSRDSRKAHGLPTF